jgi:arylsulfatase A-like enzyme
MKRTVVLVSLDTLRSDCVGAHPVKLFPGDYPSLTPPRTAVLDKLVAQGTYFLNCISAAPYTSASHAAYFTGRWPLKNGVYEIYNRSLRSRDIFQIGQAQGYRTVFKTDFPLVLGPHLGFTRGVDQYLIEDDEAFLEAMQSPEPKVAFAHFGGIHFPYGFHNLRFGGEAYREVVETLEARYPVQDFEFPDKIDETYRDDADRDMLLRYKRIVQYLYAHKLYTELFALYLQGIEFFLENRFAPFIERLTQSLEGRPYLLVIFGDHGEQWDADSYAHHNSLNEGILRVPLILNGTDIPAGKTFRQRVRTIDLFPTILEWMGIKRARGLDGESLWPLMSGERETQEDRIAFAQAHNCEPDAFTKMQAHLLRTGRKGRLKHSLTKEAVYAGNYKYMRQHYAYQDGVLGMLPQVREELYRIGEDLRPVRVHDKNRCRNMARLLDEYNLKRTANAPAAYAPDELRRYLQDFGYNV